MCVKEGFSHFFKGVEVTGITVHSGVPDQPKNSETYEGAKNRALAVKLLNDKENLMGDFFVGIEGGLIQRDGHWLECGAVYIVDKNGKSGYGTSSHWQVPKIVMERVFKGEELATIFDDIAQTTDIRSNEGAIGYLTKGAIDRNNFYKHGLYCALIPFLHENLDF